MHVIQNYNNQTYQRYLCAASAQSGPTVIAQKYLWLDCTKRNFKINLLAYNSIYEVLIQFSNTWCSKSGGAITPVITPSTQVEFPPIFRLTFQTWCDSLWTLKSTLFLPFFDRPSAFCRHLCNNGYGPYRHELNQHAHAHCYNFSLISIGIFLRSKMPALK